MRIESRPTPANLPLLGNLSPLLTRLYAARGVSSLADLDKRLQALLPFTLFKGMPEAVAVLVEALQKQQPILVVGDFDADGATASSVAVLGLRALGAGPVDYWCPIGSSSVMA
jgi:single-stranded-DNA-specific exonuclease